MEYIPAALLRDEGTHLLFNCPASSRGCVCILAFFFFYSCHCSCSFLSSINPAVIGINTGCLSDIYIHSHNYKVFVMVLGCVNEVSIPGEEIVCE